MRPNNLTTVLLSLVLAATTAHAGGPRWVTGPPYFTTSGQPVVWYTNNPLYFTDPGDLSSYVNHAAADALVANAAATWNVPTSSLTLAQGGLLAQHVSSANTYLGPAGLVFPSDVQAANAAAKPIAILYDRDGSLTDLLLGSGASDPSSCRQNAVTESVDSITPDGLIRHALLILNGRCTGPAPEQQLQLQYQLIRAFGRILGLGWSQTNDNVFTGSPTPTYQQALHWPIMHPIDVLCGLYTYQCLPQPFTLRDDDLSTLGMLYDIPQGHASNGKTDTLLNASRVAGNLLFPTGEGMQGVNVTGRRWQQFTSTAQIESWQTVSSVSGFLYRQTGPTPIAATDSSIPASQGTNYTFYQGWYQFARVPMLAGFWQQLIIETEPINPLYTGPYAVGPYPANPVTPSGSSPSAVAGLFSSYSDYEWFNYTLASAAATCNGAGGSESVPQPADPTGWWTGQLCGYGQTTWTAFTLKPNRTLTLEVTATQQDDPTQTPFPTISKAMPILGVWHASDPLGTLPTVAAATQPFNTPAAGTTALTLQGVSGPLRLAIADQRGDGRPDFLFTARILYADSIAPANLPATGGTVTITGTGFRPGNLVTVNGVPASVQSWTATSIVANLPDSRTIAPATSGSLTADIAVQDTLTGGSTLMSAALTYAAPAPPIRSATPIRPTQYIAAGATVLWTAQLLLADNSNSVANLPVTWTSGSQPGGQPTTTFTDSTGTATLPISISSLNAGDTATTQACAWAATLCATFSTIAIDPTQLQVNVHSGAGQAIPSTGTFNPLTLLITDASGHPVAGATVQVHQTIEPGTSCPATGRCPAQPTLQHSQTTLTSSQDGLVTVLPLQIPTTEVTNLVATTGTQGFLSLTLTKGW